MKCDRCGIEIFKGKNLHETDLWDINSRTSFPNCYIKHICLDCEEKWTKVFLKWKSEHPEEHLVNGSRYHENWHKVFDPWFQQKQKKPFVFR